MSQSLVFVASLPFLLTSAGFRCCVDFLQPLEPVFALDVLVKSATGLVYLHALGVAHRDFRRDNVLVFSVQPLALKVADFGLAHIQHSGGGGASATATIIGPVGKLRVTSLRLSPLG